MIWSVNHISKMASDIYSRKCNHDIVGPLLSLLYTMSLSLFSPINEGYMYEECGM
jgi:hypothetical protein